MDIDLEGASPPRHLEAALRHLGRCPRCERERRELEAALAALRAAGPVEPPEGLAESIAAALAEAPAAGWPAALLEAGGSRKWPRVARAAAALLLAAFLGFALGRKLERQEEAVKLSSALAGAAAARAELEDELLRMARRLERQEAGLAAALEEAELALTAERRLRAAAEKKAGDLEGRLRELEAQTQGLKRQLESALADRLPMAKSEPAARRSTPSAVHFRRHPGGLEIELQGSHEEVVPLLLALAREGTPAEASLALSSLEHLLGASETPLSNAAEKEAAATDGVLGVWSRKLERLARNISLDEPEAAREESAEPAASHRLRRIEETWSRLVAAAGGTSP
jgi:hypothetical protein